MNSDAVNNIPLGVIISTIVAIGVVAGFFAKIFSQIYKIKTVEEKQKELELRMNEYEKLQKEQKTELVDKVEETNTAVNLICSAVSALIDDSLQNNDESKQRLKEIKNKLDNKKEIV